MRKLYGSTWHWCAWCLVAMQMQTDRRAQETSEEALRIIQSGLPPIPKRLRAVLGVRASGWAASACSWHHRHAGGGNVTATGWRSWRAIYVQTVTSTDRKPLHCLLRPEPSSGSTMVEHASTRDNVIMGGGVVHAIYWCVRGSRCPLCLLVTRQQLRLRQFRMPRHS